MRHFFVRLTAVCFMLLGLWNVYLFILRMVTGHTNFAYALAGIILFRTGDNLFSMHEIGRKFAIGILGLNILQTLFVGYLAASGAGLTFNLLGLISLSSKAHGAFLLTAVVLAWLITNLLLGLLLLQKKTRILFQPNKPDSDPAPAQKPAAPHGVSPL